MKRVLTLLVNGQPQHHPRRPPKRSPFLNLLAASATFLAISAARAQEPAPPPPRVPVSWVDTKAALSAVTLHRGLVLAPLGSDHARWRCMM
jgi:hypothetical protein